MLGTKQQNLTTKFLNNDLKRINLDLHPSERWIPLLNEYKERLESAKPILIKLIDDMFGTYIYPIIGVIKVLRTSGQIYYADEIQSIADFLDVSFEYILLLQLCYEANSCCTSVVTKINDEYVFYRTMDWPIDILNNLTVDLEFIKEGRLLYKATSWIGYVGIATATVPEKYSIAMNFRLTQERTMSTLFQNAKNLIGMNWPVGYLIRDVCESGTNYDDMIVRMCTSSLVTPCYLTICGCNDEPKIITRGVNDHKINRNKFVVQTNCDQNKTEPNILCSVERRTTATKEIINRDNQFRSINELITALTKSPIVNEETIYYAVMSPKSGLHFSLTYFPNVGIYKNDEIIRFT